MLDHDKSKQELIEELAEMRRRVAALEDIDADHKRAEEALRQSEGRYRALAESTRDIIFILDRRGTLLYANQAASQCIGIPAGDIVGKRQVDLFPPGMARSQIEKIERVFAIGEVIEYDDLFHFGPAEVWLRIHLIPLRNEAGRITSVMGVCHNITEQKRTEETLVEREAQLLEAQEVANLGFGVVALTTGQIITSPVLDRIFGIPADYEKTIDEWTHFVHPDERQETLDYLKEVVAEKKPFDREYRIIRYGDKQVRWVHGRGALQFNKDGQPISIIGTVQDITERKLAQEALRESEERFKLFMDNSPAIAWMKDEQGRYVYANETCGRRVGIRPEDRIGKTDFELWPGEIADQFWKNDQAVLSRGQVVEVIEESTAPDGNRSYCRNFKFLFQDSTGRRFVGGVGIDITERKQAEEALQKAHDELEQRVRERTAELARANEDLRQSQATLDAFFGASTAILNICDDQFRYIKTDNLTPTYFGLDSKSIIGRSLKDDLAPQFIEEFGPMIRHVMETGEPVHNVEVKSPVPSRPGEIFFWRASYFAVPLPEGKRGYGVVGLEINERKRAEEALRQSEERFRVAFEEAPMGIIMAVGDGVLVRANRTFCQMSGYREEELIGKPVRDITHPEDRGRSEELSVQVLAGVIPGFRIEKRYLRKDGGFFWGQVAVTAVHDRGGNVIFALGIIENITERKRAEEALAKEHRNLKHMLRSSDNERQLIAYEIHDGLAQQLAGAIMQLQAFNHLKDKNPKDAANAFDAGLTILQQGHFEARRLIARVRPPILDESGVVEAVAHLVNELRREKGPKIEFLNSVEFDRLEPTLENSIYRIAQEALTNACKHSKSRRIWVSLLQRGDRLRIEIRDWGAGFDPKAVPKGHFGLEGIRQRARLLGGKCSIKSTTGKGARIRVELPVVLRDEEEWSD